jgi:hypothetical protein
MAFMSMANESELDLNLLLTLDALLRERSVTRAARSRYPSAGAQALVRRGARWYRQSDG